MGAGHDHDHGHGHAESKAHDHDYAEEEGHDYDAEGETLDHAEGELVADPHIWHSAANNAAIAQSLSATQADRVYFGTYLLWNGLNGPIGTRLVLQDMEQMLLVD